MYSRTWDEIVIPGVIGGVVAGLSATVPACLASALVGKGLLTPLELIAASVFPADANLHRPSVVLIGFSLNMVTAAALGVLYNGIVPRGVPYHWAQLTGVMYAAVMWLGVTWLLLPWLDEPLFRSYSPLFTFLYFLVYGAVLPITVALRRTVTDDEAHRHGHEVEA